MAKAITEAGFQSAAEELGVEPAVIKAVAEVESSGAGFLPDGHVKILFERHKFHEFTHGKFDDTHPNISNPRAGGYGSVKSQAGRFSEAFALDSQAAMKSASWGKFQIMGFNHEAAGFDTIGEFVDAMKISEDEHLKAFVHLIKDWGLAGALKAHNWTEFARRYNGKAFRINKYDTKLAAAYERFKQDRAAAVVPDVLAPEPEKPDMPAEPDKTPSVETLPTHPPTIEVKNQGASITTKVAAAAPVVGGVATALGIKIGNVQLSEPTLLALCGVIALALIVGAFIYNEGQKRAFERQKLSMNNLADPNKHNVVAESGD